MPALDRMPAGRVFAHAAVPGSLLHQGSMIVARIDLVGSRIVMRPNCVEFSEQLHAAAMESIATVGRWMPWCHSARTMDEGVEWLRNSQAGWDSGIEYEFTLFTPSGLYLRVHGLCLAIVSAARRSA